MKKKLVPVLAALGAAFAVQAAEVNIYGSISTGFVVSHTKGVAENDNRSTTGIKMESAWAGDSVWGITAEEDLANGFKAGVALESEYASDTGVLADENTIFGSMSYLWIGNDTVKVSVGNLGGALTSGGGDFDLIGGFDPLEAAYGLGGMGLMATKDMAPTSAIALEVMPVAGLKIALQASAATRTFPSGLTGTTTTASVRSTRTDPLPASWLLKRNAELLGRRRVATEAITQSVYLGMPNALSPWLSTSMLRMRAYVPLLTAP